MGFERESASKDVGTPTFGLTALLGASAILISPAYGLAAMVGVIVLVALLNARSLLANKSLEITTSPHCSSAMRFNNSDDTGLDRRLLPRCRRTKCAEGVAG